MDSRKLHLNRDKLITWEFFHPACTTSARLLDGPPMRPMLFKKFWDLFCSNVVGRPFKPDCFNRNNLLKQKAEATINNIGVVKTPKTFEMEIFANIINRFQALIIISKLFILDVCGKPGHASEWYIWYKEFYCERNMANKMIISHHMRVCTSFFTVILVVDFK